MSIAGEQLATRAGETGDTDDLAGVERWRSKSSDRVAADTRARRASVSPVVGDRLRSAGALDQLLADDQPHE